MTTLTLDTSRTFYQSKGFQTRTLVSVIKEKKTWLLEIIRKESVRITLAFDYSSEELLSID